MPLEMLLPPGYTSRESLKNVMKAKAQMFGDVTIEQAIELGLFVCGSPQTVREAVRELLAARCASATCWCCASSARCPRT